MWTQAGATAKCSTTDERVSNRGNKSPIRTSAVLAEAVRGEGERCCCLWHAGPAWLPVPWLLRQCFADRDHEDARHHAHIECAQPTGRRSCHGTCQIFSLAFLLLSTCWSAVCWRRRCQHARSSTKTRSRTTLCKPRRQTTRSASLSSVRAALTQCICCMSLQTVSGCQGTAVRLSVHLAEALVGAAVT